MTDRPILFSGPMVRAILEGRKTQTRRMLKPQPKLLADRTWSWRHGDVAFHGLPDIGMNDYFVGQGQAKSQSGDRLWVRESWSGNHCFRNTKPSDRESIFGEGVPFMRDEVWYWADGDPDFGDWEKPRPSIHMPRWASRLTLNVTDVRVRRLQGISTEDAIAEGCKGYVSHDGEDGETPVEEFHDLWDSLNAERGFGWDVNPWVIAYTFNVAHQNIDAAQAA